MENSRSHIGTVHLVGAGPGDAELLTLKAVRALQSADVILFDDLVSADVLELARREAKRMLVGKRGGRESCRQEDINTTMVRLAKAGKRVVRLKSGDPMVFGRAGEEIVRRMPIVDLVVGPQTYHRLPAMVRGEAPAILTDFPPEDKFDHLPAHTSLNRATRRAPAPAAKGSYEAGRTHDDRRRAAPRRRGVSNHRSEIGRRAPGRPRRAVQR